MHYGKVSSSAILNTDKWSPSIAGAMSTLHCNMTSDALKSIKFGLQWKKCKRMKILWHWKHHKIPLLRCIFPQIGTMVGLRSTIMACTLYISFFSSSDNFWNFSRQTYETVKRCSKTPLETPKTAEKRKITPNTLFFLSQSLNWDP